MFVSASEVDKRGGSGNFTLATWRMNLDGGRMLDGEPHLAGTAKPDVARLSAADAARLNLAEGDSVKIAGPSGGVVHLPLAVTDMVDGVIWLPSRINQTPLGSLLGAGVADQVQVSAEGEGA